MSANIRRIYCMHVTLKSVDKVVYGKKKSSTRLQYTCYRKGKQGKFETFQTVFDSFEQLAKKNFSSKLFER